MMLVSQQDILQVVVGVLDVVWINCIIWANALHFIRGQILRRHGYPMGLEWWFAPWRDARKLAEVAELENSDQLRIVSKWINTLIRVLLIGAVSGLILRLYSPCPV